MLSYTLFKYCYPFGHFDLKETKKRPILVNNKPNCAGITHSYRNTTQCVRTAVSLPNFIPFPRTCPGELWIWYPIFEISPFSIPSMRYAHYAPGGEKDTLFTRFYLRGWCTGPNETYPPPPPRFRYPQCDTRITRLVAKKIPFLRVFIYADDVQAPMRHTPPPPPGEFSYFSSKIQY